MKKESPKLTPKQAEFCSQYLIHLNGKQAAIRAGYSALTAESQASRLLSKVKVQSKITSLREKARQKVDITKQEIISELAAILRANIRDYMTFDGKKIEFKSFDELTETQLKAIEGIKQTKNGIELKLHGKSWSIDRICKILGFDLPQDMNIMFEKMDETTLDALVERIIGKQ
ncbi:MAG: terminase small subunit [Bacteroidota bacterium]|nr:terminase small subunit [Bacteroidota bacterium]